MKLKTLIRSIGIAIALSLFAVSTSYLITNDIQVAKIVAWLAFIISMLAVAIFALHQIIKYELNHEKIICPECGLIQYAKVEDTIPFPTYIHKCEKCEYIIMESEWQRVEELK